MHAALEIAAFLLLPGIPADTRDSNSCLTGKEHTPFHLQYHFNFKLLMLIWKTINDSFADSLIHGLSTSDLPSKINADAQVDGEQVESTESNW